jgi:hypothetical protein
VNGARRRALLLLVAGGDPHRPLDPDGRAVRALAEELRAVAPDLDDALRGLESQAAGLPGVEAALAALRDEAAYRWLALAMLAEEPADEDAGGVD